MGRSTSALLALVPSGYATSPLWIGSIACGLAFAALRFDVPFLYLMMPFATFFVAPAANLLAGSLGAPVVHDAPLSFMLGICAMALFVAGHAGNDPALLALSAFVPLLAAARSFGLLFKPTPAHRPARAVRSTSIAPADPVSPTPAVGQGASHGFDGKWFVLRITPTYDDTNSVGDIYFANYMRFVGKARELFFNGIMPDFDLSTTSFLILTKSLAHDFRGEAKEFEPIEVRIGVRRWNRKFVTLEHEIRRATGGLLGRGSQDLMFVDAKDYRLIDLPGDIVRNFSPYVLGDEPAVAPRSGLPEAQAA
jgi:acyl-CoA thioesterase FadM